MRLLILCQSEKGGAGIAATRLLKALSATDIEAKLIVRSDANRRVYSYANSFFNRIVKKTNNATIGLVSTGTLNELIQDYNPDIVHFHYIKSNFIYIRELLSVEIPVVFTFHDMWYFTGVCHYNGECLKYKELDGCKHCPELRQNLFFDYAEYAFKLKRKIMAKPNFHYVGVSNWIRNEAQNSRILGSKDIKTIPNPIDCNVYKPLSVDQALKSLGLDPNIIQKPVISFGAHDLSEKRKGFDILLNNLEQIADQYNILIFGNNLPKEVNLISESIFYYGNVGTTEEVTAIYSISKIYLHLSRQENLSNMIMESLACDTPVLALDIGGNSDLINNKTGMLINEEEPDLLSWLGLVMAKYSSYECRNSILEKFDVRKVGIEYVNFYKAIIKGK